jgi:hypothetical protein
MKIVLMYVGMIALLLLIRFIGEFCGVNDWINGYFCAVVLLGIITRLKEKPE